MKIRTVLSHVAVFAPLAGLAACTAGPDEPSKGTYAIEFPSTAAAVATDSVQVLVFAVPTPEDRPHLCQDLLRARRSREPLQPVVENPAQGTCAILSGNPATAVNVPYGEHALMAVGVRNGVDFLLGCSIQTIGDGDAPLPIVLSLADPTVGVPDTVCTSVGQFCAEQCPAN